MSYPNDIKDDFDFPEKDVSVYDISDFVNLENFGKTLKIKVTDPVSMMVKELNYAYFCVFLKKVNDCNIIPYHINNDLMLVIAHSFKKINMDEISNNEEMSDVVAILFKLHLIERQVSNYTIKARIDKGVFMDTKVSKNLKGDIIMTLTKDFEVFGYFFTPTSCNVPSIKIENANREIVTGVENNGLTCVIPNKFESFCPENIAVWYRAPKETDKETIMKIDKIYGCANSIFTLKDLGISEEDFEREDVIWCIKLHESRNYAIKSYSETLTPFTSYDEPLSFWYAKSDQKKNDRSESKGIPYNELHPLVYAKDLNEDAYKEMRILQMNESDVVVYPVMCKQKEFH